MIRLLTLDASHAVDAHHTIQVATAVCHARAGRLSVSVILTNDVFLRLVAASGRTWTST